MCKGGDLEDRMRTDAHLINGVHRFNEIDAHRLLHKMLSAICYLHQNGIAHRDIKPDNFMFTTKKKTAELKLIDFGA